MKISALLCLSFLALSCGDSDDGDSGVTTYAPPQVSAQCGNDDNSSCTTTMDGKTIRAAFFSGECSSFGSSTTILSLGTATASCTSTDCLGESQIVENWSQQLAAGDYSVYLFFDEDGNEVPNGEPYACTTVTIPAEGSTHMQDFN